MSISTSDAASFQMTCGYGATNRTETDIGFRKQNTCHTPVYENWSPFYEDVRSLCETMLPQEGLVTKEPSDDFPKTLRLLFWYLCNSF